MLRLHAGPIEPIPVPLAGGAVWFLRPATGFECDEAIAGATRILAGLVSAADSAALAADALGEEFRDADFMTPDWQAAAAERLALIELAVACTDRWQGIAFGEGEAIEKPERAHIVVALRDPVIARMIRNALYLGMHREEAEKNEYAASPSGGAATDAKLAPAAPASAIANA